MSRRYTGLHGSAKAWLISKIHREHPSLSVLCKNRASSAQLVADLKFFNSATSILEFPAWDPLPFEPVSPQIHISAERIKTLNALGNKRPAIVVAPIEALMQKILAPELLLKSNFTMKAGDTIARDELLQKLDSCGFRRVSLVEKIGELAVRGGVIDFFPSTSSDPIRLEFIGDVIEKIKNFDVNSQRSTASLGTIQILPLRECINFCWEADLKELLNGAIDKIKSSGRALETPPREIAHVINAFKTAADFPGIELSQMIALGPLKSYFDYLSNPEHLIIFDDEISITHSIDSFWDLIVEREERFKEQHYLLPAKEEAYLSPDELLERAKTYNTAYLDHLELLNEAEAQKDSQTKIRSNSNIELATQLKTKVGSGAALSPLATAIKKWRDAKYDIAFAVGSETRAKRLQKRLLNLDVDSKIMANVPALVWEESPQRPAIVILIGHLLAGFQLIDEQIVYISENEIFGERSYRKVKAKEQSLKRLLGSLSQLKEDDYVVHVDYGIGIYRGLKHLVIEGSGCDLLQIEYADSVLYLPVQNISKIQRFIGADDQQPALDKLSSTRWVKTKQKVKQNVISLAGDLIKLYAARDIAKGWRFEPFGAEDERFADTFAFNETPDQQKAIEETLADLSQDKPMDRLVCGDVGFGKTEVALRAAYKCTQHVKQVAILAPTTILVEQHYETFQKRFVDYPVKVAPLSRFYTSAQNKETLEALAAGSIDIVIGTHKLLQKDVAFADLGLLIIDEEHRFGVKQKEKLKQLKKQVDVLTLTATPIPRTLHMSLLNIRDISIISTAPHDRRVIRTYTASYDKTLVRDAILRELQRNGQCFYVHNRVQGIGLVCAMLSELVPEARFQFAHGQMSEAELEKIMSRFLKHEIDVLVCTTIIESGLDIPNVNTILIDRADTFGLAQLYQLRGRVGRSTKQAYCYFLIPKKKKLGIEANKRLQVLQSLDDLGQGFNLAIRDLEIRGAGNLLGKEQSGSVMAVGFELYSKILKEAAHHVKGEEVAIDEAVDPEININANAFIPETYIPDLSERLVLYQRLSTLKSYDEAQKLAIEIEDRFGPLNPETLNLLELMSFRSVLRSYGVIKAEINPQKVVLSFIPKAPVDVSKIVALVQTNPDKYQLSKSMTFTIKEAEDRQREHKRIYKELKDLLSSVALDNTLL